jgi:hypothetical protein
MASSKRGVLKQGMAEVQWDELAAIDRRSSHGRARRAG